MGRRKYFSSNKKLQYCRQRVTKQEFTSSDADIHVHSAYDAATPQALNADSECTTYTNAEKLIKSLITTPLPSGWTLVECRGNSGTEPNSIVYVQTSEDGSPILMYTITISKDLNFTATTYNNRHIRLPATLTVTDDPMSVLDIINYIDSLKLCPGISSHPRYLEIARKREGKIVNRQGKAYAVKLMQFTCIYIVY